MEGEVLVLFVDVDGVVDQLLELLVEVVAVLLLGVVLTVYSFYIVIILLVVRSQLRLVLEILFRPLQLLLPFLLLLLNHHCQLSQLSELFELQSLLQSGFEDGLLAGFALDYNRL